MKKKFAVIMIILANIIIMGMLGRTMATAASREDIGLSTKIPVPTACIAAAKYGECTGREPGDDFTRVAQVDGELAAITGTMQKEGVDRFTDINNHWSREYISKLALLGIIAGYPDGRFGPEDTLKADELLKMILRAMGHKVEEGIDYWAEPYINLAMEEGIIGEGEFNDYRQPIRREEAARIIVKAALKAEEAPIPNHTSYAKRRIPDYYNIGDEYKQEVLYAYSMGFITGVGGGTFLPEKTLTRGEGAAIVMRYLDKSMRKPMRPEESEIVVVSNTYNGLTYEIYQPSKPEVMDEIRLMQNNMSKNKGFASLAYNSTDEVIFFDFYISKEAYEESTIFTDCSLNIRMAEWDLNNYYIDVSKPQNTKELHRDVLMDFLNHIFGKNAEKVMKDFDEYLELGNKSSKLEKKTYMLNNREIVFIKPENDDGFSLRIDILE